MRKILSVAIALGLASSAFAGVNMPANTASTMTSSHATSFASGSPFWSVTGGVGQYRPDSKRNYNNAAAFVLDFGYHFTPLFSVHALGLFSDPEQKNTTHSHPSYLGMLEGQFNLNMGQAWVPYVAAGLGSVDVERTRFAGDLGAGLNVFFTPQVSLGVNYRYVRQFSQSRTDNVWFLGLGYRFGGSNYNFQGSLLGANTTDQNTAKSIAAFHASTPYALPSGVPQCSTQTAQSRTGCITLKGDVMTMHLNVRYGINLDSVTAQYQPSVEALAKFMKDYPKTNAVIRGYASNTGTMTYNEALSVRRAEGVKQYLVNDGISGLRLGIRGYGETHPVASNKTADGRALNRRVEATIIVPLKKQEG